MSNFLQVLQLNFVNCFDEFSIYHWDNFNDKSKCFDYGELITTREIEDNLGVDVGIIMTLMYNIPMRDQCGINGIWAEIAIILRSQIFECDLQIRGPGSNDGTLTNMSRFLQKLEHCSGENAEVLQKYTTI